MQRVHPWVRSTPVVRRALQDEVYDAVLAMLLGGEIAPGAQLGIDGLAARLGVSPTPVREALVRLEATTLVERSAMRGYRVAPPMDAAQVEELFEWRVLVECAAAERAYEHREQLVPALGKARARHAALARDLRAELPDAPSPERATRLRHYVDVDWAFHRLVASHGHNRYLQDVVSRMATNTLRLQVMSMGVPDAAESLREHGLIEQAFAEGTRDDVSAAVRDHILAVRSRALALVFPDRET